jgi:hypothetical protein
LLTRFDLGLDFLGSEIGRNPVLGLSITSVADRELGSSRDAIS